MSQTIDIGQQLKFQGTPAKQAFPNLAAFISPLLKNAYLLAGLFIFLAVLAGGFILMTVPHNPDKQQQGQKMITTALTGALIVFTAYWLIQIIEVLTGLHILHPQL